MGSRAVKWCPECNPDRTNRRKRARRIEREEGGEAARLLGSNVQKLAADAGDFEAVAPLLLAGALAVARNVRHAWRLAGLPGEPDEAVVDAAREDYADVIELKAEGFQRVGFALVMRMWTQLFARASELPANQLSPATKGIMDSLEKLQTSVSPTFGSFNVRVEVTPRKAAS